MDNALQKLKCAVYFHFKNTHKLKTYLKSLLFHHQKFSFHRTMAMQGQCIFYGKFIPQVTSLEIRDSTMSS